MDQALSPQDALVAVMVATSVADEDVATAELVSIERIVNHLPVFGTYDPSRIGDVASLVFEMFEEVDGLDALLGMIRDALPEPLYETAYAMACDVAAADGRAADAELRLLQEIRYELDISRLNAAAIEMGARARHRTL